MAGGVYVVYLRWAWPMILLGGIIGGFGIGLGGGVREDVGEAEV